MSYTLFQICSVSNLVFVPKDQYLGISCDPTLMVFQILLKLISKKMLDPFFSLGKSFDYLGSCAYFVCRPENLEEQITLCCCIILTLIGMRQGTLNPHVILGLDFVSWICIKNFQIFLEVKIEINQVNLTPCQAHWVL